jgi:release factor glutamine methyltransferase
VPTDTDEASSAQSSAGIAGSWAGGVDGMEITNRFLRDVEVSSFPMLWNIINYTSQCLLSPRGRFYLVALQQNHVSSIRSRMLEDFGLASQVNSTCLVRVDHTLTITRLSSNDGREESFY